MPTERERKFRVLEHDPARLPPGEPIRQGYLCTDPVVRVRLQGERATLTIKGPGTHEREEYEYPIPAADARELLGLAVAVLEKTRHVLARLEIDVFSGPLAGLVLAEAEGVSATEPIAPPEGMTWVEVTGRPEYLNSNLAQRGSLGPPELDSSEGGKRPEPGR